MKGNLMLFCLEFFSNTVAGVRMSGNISYAIRRVCGALSGVACGVTCRSHIQSDVEAEKVLSE